MAGLLDFFQGASNAAASNISAPVDGLAWLLRKAGMDINMPVGGSDWMRKKGLTAEPKNKWAGLLGESVGGISPLLAAAKAPQIAGGLLKGAENLAAPRTLNPQTGAVVWHGSPHKFDKFDASKIGTGEGAQAYGHGLYLADSQDVAKGYQKSLSGREYVVDGVSKMTIGSPASRNAGIQTPSSEKLAMMIAEDHGGFDKAIVNLKKQLAQPDNLTDVSWINRQLSALQPFAKNSFESRQLGSLYKVDLPDEHIAKMLDWDKPLSGQSKEVQRAADSLAGERMRQLLDSQKSYGITNKYDTLTGEEFLRGLGKGGAAESALKAQGIPGIRYLDGGSRGAGAGSSNYVVFPGNEGLLSILERNGKSLNKETSWLD